MKQRIASYMFLMCALPLTQAAWAQNGAPDRISGTWDVKVTIASCSPGGTSRTVHALNLFIDGGKLVETAANPLRSPSVGTWTHAGGQRFMSTFRFFRYNTDGTVASRALVTRMIQLDDRANTFTSTGTVQDFNVDTNMLISISCATETATRLDP